MIGWVAKDELEENWQKAVYDMRRIYLLAEEILFTEEGIQSIELVKCITDRI
jgi:hypothetical protein